MLQIGTSLAANPGAAIDASPRFHSCRAPVSRRQVFKSAKRVVVLAAAAEEAAPAQKAQKLPLASLKTGDVFEGTVVRNSGHSHIHAPLAGRLQPCSCMSPRFSLTPASPFTHRPRWTPLVPLSTLVPRGMAWCTFLSCR
jgi:hypothetical protein